MRRLLSFSVLAATALLAAGCGSIAYELTGHSAQVRTVAVTLKPGERRAALSTPARLPAPGGFELFLASENPAVVSVEREAGTRGAARLHLVARAVGTTTVHYVNRYAVSRDAADARELAELRQMSMGAFTVAVAP